MARWLLAFALAGCGAQAKRPQDEAVRAIIGCTATGETSRGAFGRPIRWFTEEVDADLAPRILATAQDPHHEQIVERTEWIYDAERRLVGREVSDDGDLAPEWIESWTLAPDGAPQTWTLVDARGAIRAQEWRIQGRYGRLFRLLSDDDGDGRIDRLSEHDWDADGRLQGIDTWDPEDDSRISRLAVEYLEPAPAMDRLERFDADGDNIPDEGTIFRYDADGLLQTTETLARVQTEYAWDEAGRLIASVETGPDETVTWEAAYTELGLPSWTREDIDRDADGEVDRTEITRWEWDCED